MRQGRHANAHSQEVAMFHSLFRRVLILFVLPAALGLARPIVAAPAAAEPPQGSFTDSIEVRVTNIEVVVTDKEGNRVFGLGPEDFRLLVDDEQVPIGYFSEIREGKTTAFPEAPTADVPPSEPETAVPVKAPEPAPLLPAGEPVRTNYLLFIDDYLSAPGRRNLVLERIRKDLDMLEPQDRFAAVAFPGHKLDLITDWSSSREQIERVLEEAEERPIWLAQKELQKIDDIETIMTRRTNQLRRTYAAVGTAMRSFANAPGRRVLLLTSGGWPFDVSMAYQGPTVKRSRVWNTRKALDRLFAVAHQTGFTVYPIDLPGLQTQPISVLDSDPRPTDLPAHVVFNQPKGRAESRDPPPPPPIGGELAAKTLDFNWGRFISGPSQEYENEVTLLLVAEATGGEALLNSRRMRALSAAVEDTRSYYWLGFDHTVSGDDRYRSVEVVALRPGLRVRARKGFTDLSVAAEVDFVVESVLLLAPTSEIAGLRVELGEPRPAGRRQLQVPFTVNIALSKIAIRSADDGLRAVLELRVAAVNERGERSEIARLPLDLHLSPAMTAAPEVIYEASVQVRNRSQRLAFVLHDLTSGNVLASHAALDI
ncbi:MAG: VWA domain-containing protein [bacterium]|nr:VWA domain-containing protein [bacterium]